MTRNSRVLISLVSAMVCVAGLSADHAALSADHPAPAAELPCESEPVPTDTTNKPQAPTNLKIVGGGEDFDQEPWELEGDASGPFVGKPEMDQPENEAGLSDWESAADGPHAYYEALASRGDCKIAFSLRNQAQIEQYRRSRSEPSQVNYLWPNDPDPRRQDAAKIVIPGNNLRTQVWLPIKLKMPGRYLVSFDAWMGREFDFDKTGISQYKTFQFGSPQEDIWTEVNHHFGRAKTMSDIVAMLEGRYYGSVAQGTAGNLTDNNPIEPQITEVPVRTETWMRFWAFFETDGADWDTYTLWAADRFTDPKLVYDRLQLKARIGTTDRSIGIFRLEYNTSTTGAADGRAPLVSYFRNLVVLEGVTRSTAQGLLQKPAQ